MKKNYKFGFTLIEIMVAVTILSLMTYVLWQTFLTFRKMNDISTWQSARQIELKNAIKLIRTDLQEASYPTVVTRVDSRFVEQDSHALSYKAGGPFVIDSASAGEYLKFYMCKPYKKVYPDGDARNSEGYVAECTLSFEGTNLKYVRTMGQINDPVVIGIDANEIRPVDKILVRNVSAFNIGVVAGSASESQMNFCTMTITCLHPNPKLNSKVTERTGTKVDVAANPDL